jgi:tRNA/rRNA methyltransferase/tRNA (cytidine32/uridine32-2'-O)-methyltransferase
LLEFAFFYLGIVLLARIRIVLVETSHPGNIGAVARAMKNMSLATLYLVAPKIFPSADATARASGADDILAAAVVCENLSDAIADCQLVIGASARSRTIAWPQLNPHECAQLINTEAQYNQVAIVFGRENSGLKNRELDVCQYLLTIPCNSAYSSLNLAAAVQVVCYELFIAAQQQSQPQIELGASLATAEQMASFYQHLKQALVDIDFMHPDKSKSVMRRLRRIYNRVHLDTNELNILRGILTMSQGNKKDN